MQRGLVACAYMLQYLEPTDSDSAGGGTRPCRADTALRLLDVPYSVRSALGQMVAQHGKCAVRIMQSELGAPVLAKHTVAALFIRH